MANPLVKNFHQIPWVEWGEKKNPNLIGNTLKFTFRLFDSMYVITTDSDEVYFLIKVCKTFQCHPGCFTLISKYRNKWVGSLIFPGGAHIVCIWLKHSGNSFENAMASYSKACSSLSVLYLVVSRRSLPLSTAESLTKTLLTSRSASSHRRGLISKCLWPKFTSLPDTLCMKGAQTIHDWIIWQLLWAQPKKARVLYQNSAFYSFYIVFLVFMEMAIIRL